MENYVDEMSGGDPRRFHTNDLKITEKPLDLGFAGTASRAAELHWVNPSALSDESKPVDPEWNATKDPVWETVDETLDIDQLQALADSGSREEYDVLLNDFNHRANLRKDLAEQGGMSNAALELAVAILDPTFIAAGAVTESVGWWALAPLKGARLNRTLKRMGAMGVIGGGTDAAIGAIRMATEGDYTEKDLIQDVLFSTLLSTPFGAIRTSDDKVQDALAKAVNQMEVEDAKDLKALTSGNPRDAAGADRVKEVDQLQDGATRWDPFAQAARSANAALRKFKNILEDGVKGGNHSAALYVERKGNGWHLDTVKSLNNGYHAWAKETGKNTWNPWKTAEQRKDFQRSVYRYVEFDELPQMGAEGIKQAGDGLRKVTADILKEAQRSGLKGFDKITTNKNYLPRFWDDRALRKTLLADPDNERKLINLMVRSLAHGARNAGNDIDEEKIARIAIGFVTRKFDAVTKEHRSIDELLADETLLKGADVEFSPEQQEWVNAAIKDARKSSKADRSDVVDRAKSRMELDMSMEYEGLKLTDLVETDSAVLMRRYVSNMSANIGLAKHADISSPSELKALLDEVELGHPDTGLDDRKKAEQWLKQLYKQPVYGQESGNWERGFRLAAKFNYNAGMGMAAFAAVGELGRSVAQNGMRNTIRQIPEFGTFLKTIRKVDAESDNLVAEVNAFGAAIGEESTMSLLNTHIDEDMLARGERDALGIAETLMDSTTRVMQRISLMAPVDKTLRQVAFTSSVDAMFRHFRDGSALKWDLKELGLSSAQMEMIKKEMMVEGRRKSGFMDRTVSLGLDQWDPDTADLFVSAMVRKNGRDVQKSLVGEDMVMLDHPVAKILFQFRRFGLTSFIKHTHHDIYQMKQGNWGTTSLGIMYSSILAGLAYSSRTYVQSVGRDDQDAFLEERLAPEAVIANAVNYTPFMGMPVQGWNTAASVGFVPPIPIFRSSGDSFEPYMNPTFSNVTRLGTFGRAVSPWGDDQDMKAAAYHGSRLLPWNNTIPMTFIKNAAISSID